MKKIIHRADSRGFADHGWLKAAHSFSFAGYLNREKMHFGALRVLNDDLIAPAKGFGTHPHESMEIITIPLEGSIRHKDSTGVEGVITAGDVQVMSAGTGIAHSEFNASSSEPLSLLQIWVFPNREGTPPRYQQAHFSRDKRQDMFRSVASGLGTAGALEILQSAEISLADLSEGASLEYQIKAKGNGAYIFLIDGAIDLANEQLSRRDALGLSETTSFSIRAKKNSKVVVLDVPMEF